MNNVLDIILTSKFKKDLKTYAHKQDILNELDYCITLIQNHTTLPSKYKDHPLTGNWKGKRDCHVRSDDILIYQISGNNLILVRFASHSKLGLTENIQKPLKLKIKESYELTEANRPNVFDYKKDRAFGDVVDPNEKVGNVSLKDYYKFEKGKDAIISWMTGDEYIDKCIRYIFKSNYKKVVDNSVDWKKVNEYAELMKNGTIFPTGYLDYTVPTQEGRHRALAFKQTFGADAEMPVIEIFPTDVTNDEIYDYCKRRWGNGNEWFGYVASKLGRSGKEINDYLGIEPEPENIEDIEYKPDNLDNIDDLLDDEDLIEDDTEFYKFCSKELGREINSMSDLSNAEFNKLLMRYIR